MPKHEGQARYQRLVSLRSRIYQLDNASIDETSVDERALRLVGMVAGGQLPHRQDFEACSSSYGLMGSLVELSFCSGTNLAPMFQDGPVHPNARLLNNYTRGLPAMLPTVRDSPFKPIDAPDLQVQTQEDRSAEELSPLLDRLVVERDHLNALMLLTSSNPVELEERLALASRDILMAAGLTELAWNWASKAHAQWVVCDTWGLLPLGFGRNYWGLACLRANWARFLTLPAARVAPRTIRSAFGIGKADQAVVPIASSWIVLRCGGALPPEDLWDQGAPEAPGVVAGPGWIAIPARDATDIIVKRGRRRIPSIEMGGDCDILDGVLLDPLGSVELSPEELEAAAGLTTKHQGSTMVVTIPRNSNR